MGEQEAACVVGAARGVVTRLGRGRDHGSRHWLACPVPHFAAKRGARIQRQHDLPGPGPHLQLPGRRGQERRRGDHRGVALGQANPGRAVRAGGHLLERDPVMRGGPAQEKGPDRGVLDRLACLLVDHLHGDRDAPGKQRMELFCGGAPYQHRSMVRCRDPDHEALRAAGKPERERAVFVRVRRALLFFGERALWPHLDQLHVCVHHGLEAPVAHHAADRVRGRFLAHERGPGQGRVSQDQAEQEGEERETLEQSWTSHESQLLEDLSWMASPAARQAPAPRDDRAGKVIPCRHCSGERTIASDVFSCGERHPGPVRTRHEYHPGQWSTNPCVVLTVRTPPGTEPAGVALLLLYMTCTMPLRPTRGSTRGRFQETPVERLETCIQRLITSAPMTSFRNRRPLPTLRGALYLREGPLAFPRRHHQVLLRQSPQSGQSSRSGGARYPRAIPAATRSETIGCSGCPGSISCWACCYAWRGLSDSREQQSRPPPSTHCMGRARSSRRVSMLCANKAVSASSTCTCFTRSVRLFAVSFLANSRSVFW